MDWVNTLVIIGKIIAAIILVIIIAGSGLFGYIAWRAEARKWGVGMFAILAACIFLFYWLLADTFGLPFPI